MVEATALMAVLKPAVLAVTACAMNYVAVAVDRRQQPWLANCL